MGKIALSGVHHIDSLLWHKYKFGGAIGQGATINYAFANTEHWPDNDPRRALFTSAQKAMIKRGLQAWSDVANINWVLTENLDAAPVRFYQILNNGPGVTRPVIKNNTIALIGATLELSGVEAGGFEKGGGAYAEQLLHEIGHLLGLKHPHDSGDFGPVANRDIDTTRFSVMSYRSYAGQIKDGYPQTLFPTTPMLHDIAAMQYIYGANMNTHTGNDVYNWNNLSAVGENGQRGILTTIWDAGGIDTIDWSDQSSPAVINLNPGQWSELGPAYWNGREWEKKTLAIAYNTDSRIDPKRTAIENAYGGIGNDTIIGNAANNVLSGGRGNDRLVDKAGRNFLYGGAGNDYLSVFNEDDVLRDVDSQLYGESGNDSLFGGIGNNFLSGGDGHDLLQDSEGNDTLYGGQGNDSLSSWTGNDILFGEAGDDWLDGAFNNDTLYGGDGNDTLGNSYHPESGNDQMFGEGGNDLIYGGAGTDTLVGGAGNDYLVGFGYDSSAELDILTGGMGADKFVLGNSKGGNYFGTGYGVITDFNWSEGDRIVINEGMSSIFGFPSGYSLVYGNWLGSSTQDTAIFYNNNSDQICLVQDFTLSRSHFGGIVLTPLPVSTITVS